MPETLESSPGQHCRRQHSLIKNMQQLIPLVQNGFPQQRQSLPVSLQAYWQYKDQLSLVDGVLMMDVRMVIPEILRHSVLQALHAAHQGVSGMRSQTQDTVFWPGISKDLEHVRNQCGICTGMAPSQPHLPPTHSAAPFIPIPDHCGRLLLSTRNQVRGYCRPF